MLHPSYGSPSSFSSAPGSLGYRKRFLGWDWDKKLHYDRELPAWSTEGPKELVVTRKRPWQDSQPDERSKKVAWDRLTFVPGTFRPVLIVDDDGYLDPVVPRKIDWSGWSRDCPLIVEDDLVDSATTESSATNPNQEFRHAQNDLNWVDATTTWIARKPAGCTQSPPNNKESAPWTGSYIPKFNRQESFECSNSTADNNGISAPWKPWPIRKYHPYLPREQRSTSLPTSLDEAKDFAPRSTLPGTEDEGGAWSDNTITTPTRRSVVKDRLPIRERKAFFIHTPTSALTSAMSKFVGEVYAALPSSREEDECWLHPSPPRGYGRDKGCLSRFFCWTDESGRHKLNINLGIIALIVDSSLTEKQKEGWIMDSWHLSHLCGNWTCCNWRHFTVEPGRVNISRNACFMHRSGCIHEPKCMKEKKQRLSQIPRNPELIAESHQVSEVTEEKEERACTAHKWGQVFPDTDR